MLVALYLCYFVFTYFAVLNVITGVFCQSAIESATTNKELATMQKLADKQKWTEAMREVFGQMDNDNNGDIDIYEFQSHLNNDKMLAYLSLLDIDVGDAWTLFKLLDTSSDGLISVDEFVDGL